MRRLQTFSRPPVHWWSKALADKRRQVNRARKQLERNHQVHLTATLYDSYLRLRREYRNNIKANRQESWQRFSSEQGASPWGPLYIFVSRSSPQATVPTTVRNSNTGQLTSTPAETADYLLTQYFADDDPITDIPLQQSDRNRSEYALPDSTDDPQFTALELSSVIASFSPKKAPGLDGFSAAIIIRVHTVMPALLLSLFNLCLVIGHFPTEWKAAAVKLLPKPGQTENTHKACRPISLLPLLGKCLEKLISRRLSWYALTKNWISEDQFAFLPDRSAEDALVALTMIISEAFQRKEYCLAIKVDINGAFDNCWWPAILNYLTEQPSQPVPCHPKLS
jgi:hypothetical protein